MVNLVPAKCPCCGGQLELDDNMKRAECKYCRNTIIVDEAIEKFKTDSQGNLKISGIKDQDKLLEEARKYYKLKRYQDAIDTCSNIISIDAFNDDAFALEFKSAFEQLKSKGNLVEEIRNGNDKFWNLALKLKKFYAMMQDVIKANNSKDYIYNEIGEDLLEEYDNLVKLMNNCENPNDNNYYVSKIKGILDKYKKYAKNVDSDEVVAYLMGFFGITYDNGNDYCFTKESVNTLKFNIVIDKQNNEIWKISFTRNRLSNVNDTKEESKNILHMDYDYKLKNLYDKLENQYNNMEKGVDAGIKVRDKLNNFIKNGNFFTKSKRIKYLADYFGIDYTNGLEFTKVSNSTILYKIKLGFTYEENFVRKYHNMKEIECYLANYK